MRFEWTDRVFNIQIRKFQIFHNHKKKKTNERTHTQAGVSRGDRNGLSLSIFEKQRNHENPEEDVILRETRCHKSVTPRFFRRKNAAF